MAESVRQRLRRFQQRQTLAGEFAALAFQHLFELQDLAGLRDVAAADQHHLKRQRLADGHDFELIGITARGEQVDDVTFERAVQLLADKRAKGPAPKRTTKRATTTRKTTAKK